MTWIDFCSVCWGVKRTSNYDLCMQKNSEAFQRQLFILNIASMLGRYTLFCLLICVQCLLYTITFLKGANNSGVYYERWTGRMQTSGTASGSLRHESGRAGLTLSFVSSQFAVWGSGQRAVQRHAVPQSHRRLQAPSPREQVRWSRHIHSFNDLFSEGVD